MANQTPKYCQSDGTGGSSVTTKGTGASCSTISILYNQIDYKIHTHSIYSVINDFFNCLPAVWFDGVCIDEVIMAYRVLAAYAISLKYGKTRKMAHSITGYDIEFVKFYDNNVAMLMDIADLLPTPIVELLNVLGVVHAGIIEFVVKFEPHDLLSRQWTHLNLESLSFTPQLGVSNDIISGMSFDVALDIAKEVWTQLKYQGSLYITRLNRHTLGDKIMLTKYEQGLLYTPTSHFPLPDRAKSIAFNLGADINGSPYDLSDYNNGHVYVEDPSVVIQWFKSFI